MSRSLTVDETYINFRLFRSGFWQISAPTEKTHTLSCTHGAIVTRTHQQSNSFTLKCARTEKIRNKRLWTVKEMELKSSSRSSSSSFSSFSFPSSVCTPKVVSGIEVCSHLVL